jgi:spermidine synthase
MDDSQRNFKIETAYNSIHLVYDRGQLQLRSRDKALQSVINLETPQQLELANLEYLMSVLLFVTAPRRILMLGTAAGSLLHFLQYHYPQAEITAVDIDTELIEQLLQLEILPPASSKLSYLCDDAAHFLAQSKQEFDLVLVDIFHGSQSPRWLLQKSSIQQLYERTASGGALAFNLLVDSEHDFRIFCRDLRQRFHGKTLSLPVAGLENKIVYGIRNPAAAGDMSANMRRAQALSAQLGIDLVTILSVIYNTNPVGQGLI